MVRPKLFPGLLFAALVCGAVSSGQLFSPASAQTNQGAAPPPPRQDQPPAPATEPAAVPTAPAPHLPPVKKVPIPPDAALQAAMKLVNEVYAGDLARATPEQRLEIAKKMGQTGLDTTDDAAGRFALLSKATDVATQAGDMGVAFGLIDDLDQFYLIDALKMQAATATLVSNAALNPDQRSALAAELTHLVDKALAADRYDLARSMADLAVSSARLAGDADLQRDMAAKAREVREFEAAYAGIKTAVVVLADKPDDPDANLRVGRFRCFFKGDWAGGLPLLARGSHAMLKALAARELLGATEPDAQVALGDSWWAAAEKEDGLAKSQFQKRAGKWYNDAAPHLSGFAKAKVEVRLKNLAVVDASRIVNLLKLVDVTRDAVAGKWELRNGMLASDKSGPAKIEFLYQPPAEYDYKVVFKRMDGTNDVAFICSAQGHPFYFSIDSYAKILGFGFINKADINENKTGRTAPKGWLANGRPYTSFVKVRKNSVQAYLNGQLVAEWKTDYSDMSLSEGWGLHHGDRIGLGTYESPTIFQSAEIIEITGKGQILKPESP